MDFRSPPGFDRTRNVEIGNKHFKLEHLEEAYTTEHWIVRIYKVKKPSNRIQNKEILREIRRKKTISSKKTKKRQGVINNKPKVVKGKSVRVDNSKK
jgi:dolichyl-diphosphooligosaccharide---protein glycosyltransferase